jgi:hypothetical protein
MDNIKVDISETGCEDVDRIQLAQNTVYWRDIADTTEALLDQMRKRDLSARRNSHAVAERIAEQNDQLLVSAQITSIHIYLSRRIIRLSKLSKKCMDM